MLSDQERERVAGKAPVWAQDIIYRLNRQLAEAHAQIEKLNEGPKDSNVLVVDHVYGDRLLGSNVPVRFVMPDGYVVVEHGQDEGTVTVRSIGRGRKQALAVIPQSSNAAKLRLTEY